MREKSYAAFQTCRVAKFATSKLSHFSIDLFMARSRSKLEPAKLTYLQINRIKPSPFGHRESRTGILKGSVKTFGVLQNVIVRPVGTDRYQIVSGDGRLAEAKRAGLKKIPALVVENCNENNALLLHGVENICRDNLNPIEEGAFFSELRRQGFKLHEIAQLLGERYSESTVGHRIEMHQKLSEKGKEAVVKGLVNIRAVIHAFDRLPQQEAAKTVELLAGKGFTTDESVAYIEALKPSVEVAEKAKSFQGHTPNKTNASQGTDVKQEPKRYHTIYKLELSGSVTAIGETGIDIRSEKKNKIQVFSQLEQVKGVLMSRLRPEDLLTITVRAETPVEGKTEPVEVPALAET